MLEKKRPLRLCYSCLGHAQEVVEVCSRGWRGLLKRSVRFAQEVGEVCSRGRRGLLKRSVRFAQEVGEVCLRGR